MSIHRDRFFRVELAGDIAVARVARTAEPLDDPNAGAEAFRTVANLVWPRPRAELRLLFDLRLAPPRNDDVFEKIVNDLTPIMFVGWAKMAVLVKTQVGKLQVSRLNRERGGGAEGVFTDENAAMAYLLA